jgi:hypothetical protein
MRGTTTTSAQSKEGVLGLDNQDREELLSVACNLPLPRIIFNH